MLMREGNMGDKYEETRHNIGWMAADRIQANPELQFDQWQSRYSGMIAKGVNPKDGCTLWVLKPLTFMNLSGCSVATAAEGLGLGLGDICVMHDDIDLAPGRVKMKRLSLIHISEPTRLLSISYAVFCLKKKKKTTKTTNNDYLHI
eukprot:TRINITY_DN61033_c0_g2_i2.p1 TRINITY_DN61033_c0_g2~~TRINITY_DN61033_c0_g2_i2.p1  ORF type:complete len:146 (+),score=33.03 TRINITY_DN61033_c0_g2_i2:151-588(+)